MLTDIIQSIFFLIDIVDATKTKIDNKVDLPTELELVPHPKIVFNPSLKTKGGLAMPFSRNLSQLMLFNIMNNILLHFYLPK